MNGYSFTEHVRRTLARAREEAADLGHEHVACEHILLQCGPALYVGREAGPRALDARGIGDLAIATRHVLLAYLALRPAQGFRALTERRVTHASVRALAEKIFG